MEPAETPASTTPASQARRKLWSRPCSRHSASRFATLPPPTQTASCSSSRPVMSSLLGMLKRFRCDTVMPCARPAASSHAWKYRWSPPAVPTWHSLGARPVTPETSMACSTSALNSTSVRLPRRRPPEVARMVGVSAGMAEQPTRARWRALPRRSGRQPVPGDRLREDLGELALCVVGVRLEVLAHPLPRRDGVVPEDRRVDLVVIPEDGCPAVAGIVDPDRRAVEDAEHGAHHVAENHVARRPGDDVVEAPAAVAERIQIAGVLAHPRDAAGQFGKRLRVDALGREPAQHRFQYRSGL